MPQIGAKKTVLTSFQINREQTLLTVIAVAQVDRSIRVFCKNASVTEFAFVELKVVHAATVLGRIVSVHAVLLVVIPERQVAVLVCE